MKHKDKVKLARKLRTRMESKKRLGFPKGSSIFQTKAWEIRKKAIQERIKRRQTKKR